MMHRIANNTSRYSLAPRFVCHPKTSLVPRSVYTAKMAVSNSTAELSLYCSAERVKTAFSVYLDFIRTITLKRLQTFSRNSLMFKSVKLDIKTFQGMYINVGMANHENDPNKNGMTYTSPSLNLFIL